MTAKARRFIGVSALGLILLSAEAAPAELFLSNFRI